MARDIRATAAATGYGRPMEGQEWHLHLQLVLGLFFDWHKCNFVLDMQTRLIVSYLGPAPMLCMKIIFVIFVFFFCCYCWVESSNLGMGSRLAVLFDIVRARGWGRRLCMLLIVSASGVIQCMLASMCGVVYTK